MGDLKKGVWSELNKGDNIDIYRRNLQRSYILRLVFLMENDQPSRSGWQDYITNVKVDVSDIRSVTMGTMLELRKEIKKSIFCLKKDTGFPLNFCIVFF